MRLVLSTRRGCGRVVALSFQSKESKASSGFDVALYGC